MFKYFFRFLGNKKVDSADDQQSFAAGGGSNYSVPSSAPDGRVGRRHSNIISSAAGNAKIASINDRCFSRERITGGFRVQGRGNAIYNNGINYHDGSSDAADDDQHFMWWRPNVMKAKQVNNHDDAEGKAINNTRAANNNKKKNNNVIGIPLLLENQNGDSGDDVVKLDFKTSATAQRRYSARQSSVVPEKSVNDSHNNSSQIISRNIPQQTQGEQISAGWPPWLTAVAGEALVGWLPRRADSFQKIDKIGQGTYSYVYKAKDLETGKFVALKKVRFDKLEPESVRFMAREIKILRRLHYHPNVIRLEGLVTSRISCSLYLVFEYMDHDLAAITTSQNVKFSEAQVKCYMRQILKGLEHCHKRGVLHRDIKGSNLLIDAKTGNLKIADFGLATCLSWTATSRAPLTTRVVTLWYRPPELLLGATLYGTAVDLWSVGCVMGELFARRPILPAKTEVEQLHKIFKLCGSPPEEYWTKYKLPHAMLFKPQRPYRRTLSETFKYFPETAIRLLDVLLAFDPKDRGSASSALQHDFFKKKPLPCDPSDLPKLIRHGQHAGATKSRRRAEVNKEQSSRSERPDVDLLSEHDQSMTSNCYEINGDKLKVESTQLEQAGNRRLHRAPDEDQQRAIEVDDRNQDTNVMSNNFRSETEGNLPFRILSTLLQTSSNNSIDNLQLKESEITASSSSSTTTTKSKSAYKLLSGPLTNTSQAELASNLINHNVIKDDSRSTRYSNKIPTSTIKDDINVVQNQHQHHMYRSKTTAAASQAAARIHDSSTIAASRATKPKMHFSGLLLPPSANVDQIMHERELQIQSALRRARDHSIMYK